MSLETGRRNDLAMSDDDKRGVVVIVTAIGVSWTLLTLVIRLVSKLHVKSTLGHEEILVIVASACAFSSSACIFLAVRAGFGLNSSDQTSDLLLLKCLWLADIFYCISLAVAKGATIPLLFQLTPMRKVKHYCLGLAAIIVCWGVIATFLIGLRCHASNPWLDVDNRCSSLFDRWLVLEILSILIEMTLFGLFVGIVCMLQMKNAMKLKVIIAFAIRLTVVMPSILRIVYLGSGMQDVSDSLFGLVNAVCATQAVLHYTTMAASFAYLKPFLRAFDSNFSATVKVDTVVSSGYPYASSGMNSSNRDHKEGVMLSDMSQSRMASRSDDPDAITPAKSRRSSWMPQHEQKSKKRGSKRRTSKYSSKDSESGHEKHDSSESMAPIITKTQEWTVHTESKEKMYHAM